MNKGDNGVLFRNTKATKDTHPTHTGTCTIGGVDYWVSAWIKESDKGKYFSMAFRKKEPEQTAMQLIAELDDDIPF